MHVIGGLVANEIDLAEWSMAPGYGRFHVMTLFWSCDWLVSSQ